MCVGKWDNSKDVPNGRHPAEFEGKGKADDARTREALSLLVFR